MSMDQIMDQETVCLQGCRYYQNVESLLERAKFYRGTFALQEALHGFRSNDREAFESGMENYV